MATITTVSKNGSKRINIEMNTASGIIDGKPYSQFGPAYLIANDDDGLGHGYRLFLAECEIPAAVNDKEAALAVAQMEFAESVSAAERLDVIATVHQYGNGEYVADLRNTAWWIND